MNLSTSIGIHFISVILLMISCKPTHDKQITGSFYSPDSLSTPIEIKTEKQPVYVVMKSDAPVNKYFSVIDSITNIHFDSTQLFKEYILVNSNPWIIDTLRSFDYYQQIKNGRFIYDQSKQIVLHRGDSLKIPDSVQRQSLLKNLLATRIDVNLPEFKLRLIQNMDTIFTCPVRIGQNKTTYLKFLEREVDLRTPIGEGNIVNINRAPKYIDMQTGEEYIETNRDDGQRTKMPLIPSLEPMINNRQTGSLIHATTNPRSLGKIYSNGCVGTSEADMWVIYYHCPEGTKVTFRYNLIVKNNEGKTITLKDVYQLQPQ